MSQMCVYFSELRLEKAYCEYRLKCLKEADNALKQVKVSQKEILVRPPVKECVI